MGMFSGTAKGSNPMTTGGKGTTSGKNKSPFALDDKHFSAERNAATRALAAKYSKDLNTNRTLSKPVTNAKSIIKAQ